MGGANNLMTTPANPASTFRVTLWRIFPPDGSTPHAYTTGTREVTVGGVTYKVCAITPSQQQQLENLEAGNLEAVLPLSVEGITNQQLLNGYWNHAKVEVRRYDYKNDLVRTVWRGILSDVDTDNGILRAEVLDLAVLLQQQTGDVYAPQCRDYYGGLGCGATPVTAAVIVTAVASRREFTVTHTLSEAKFFDYGIAEFTGGDNIGLSKEIKTAVQDGTNLVVTLVEEMSWEIGTGDAVTLKEGCDGEFTTCIRKGRAKRFRAEPPQFFPGVLKLLEFPR